MACSPVRRSNIVRCVFNVLCVHNNFAVFDAPPLTTPPSCLRVLARIEPRERFESFGISAVASYDGISSETCPMRAQRPFLRWVVTRIAAGCVVRYDRVDACARASFAVSSAGWPHMIGGARAVALWRSSSWLNLVASKRFGFVAGSRSMSTRRRDVCSAGILKLLRASFSLTLGASRLIVAPWLSYLCDPRSQIRDPSLLAPIHVCF